MYKTLLCLVLVIGVSTSAFSQTADVEKNIAAKQTTYEIKLADGSTRKIQVKYEANIFNSIDVTGDKASVLHPVDTRRFDVKLSGVIDRILATSQDELVTFPELDKKFVIASKQQIFQNFQFFGQTDRSAEIASFASKEGQFLALDLKNAWDKKIVEDEASVIKDLKEKYGAVDVKKISE